MPAIRKNVVRKKKVVQKKPLARVMVRPPGRASDGALTVRKMFGENGLLVRKDAVPKQYRFVLNWGNPTAINAAAQVKVFNKPSAVATAINKLAAFKKLKEAGISIPDFVEKYPSPKKMWFARTKLNASCGDGIIVVRPEDLKIPAAPLYVEYVKKTTEYRIHVVNGRAIFAQIKKKRAGFEQDKDEKLIRNYDNGWVFALADIAEVPEAVKTQCVNAVAALELDFGAVDVIIGRDDNTPYVLEINTAPGIESPTLTQAYKDAFTQLVA